MKEKEFPDNGDKRLGPFAAALTCLGSWRYVVLYWAMLLVAIHIPPLRARGVEPAAWDKVVHLAIYGGFAFLLAMFASTKLQWRRGRGLMIGCALAWLVAVGQGAIDEWTQPWTGRDAELFDWFADCAGAAIGVLAAALIARRLPLLKESPREDASPVPSQSRRRQARQ